MHSRWLIYVVVSLIFGVVIWYLFNWVVYPLEVQATRVYPYNAPLLSAMYVLSYGIWLTLVIPVAIHEVIRSYSLFQAALSAGIVWVVTMFSYDVYFAFNALSPDWMQINFLLFRELFHELDLTPKALLFELAATLIGGMIVGLISAYVYQRISQWE